MDNEYDAWDRLMLTWGIDVEDKQHPGEVSESIVGQLLDRGAQASTRMASMYDKVFDLSDTESGTVLPYNAFHENDTDGLCRPIGRRNVEGFLVHEIGEDGI